MTSQCIPQSFPSDAFNYGLEMQAPWAMHLLEGRKTIEVRNYTLPQDLLDRKIFILESLPGQDGVSSLGDRIELGTGEEAPCRIRGWCKFGSVKEYTTQDVFQNDQPYHLVSPDSGYAWKEGKTTILYGWEVKEIERFEEGKSNQSFTHACRRMRSIFEMHDKPS